MTRFESTRYQGGPFSFLSLHPQTAPLVIRLDGQKIDRTAGNFSRRHHDSTSPETKPVETSSPSLLLLLSSPSSSTNVIFFLSTVIRNSRRRFASLQDFFLCAWLALLTCSFPILPLEKQTARCVFYSFSFFQTRLRTFLHFPTLCDWIFQVEWTPVRRRAPLTLYHQCFLNDVT